MTIRKVNGLEAHYSILPNAMVNDNLSWEAIGVLAYLISKPDDWNVSVQQLVNQSKKSAYKSGRDKTYRILRELQDAGYIQAENTRENGRFTGKNYIVSPVKLPPKEEPDPRFTDKPLTDSPSTAETTLQNKENNKEKNKQISENVSSQKTENQSLQKVKKIEVARKEQTRTNYPAEFDQFFKAYPKTNGSKKEALREWKTLSTDQRKNLFKSLSAYKAHLQNEAWKQPMGPGRYIRGEHYLLFLGLDEPQEGAQKISVNGRQFDAEAIKQLCVTYFKSSGPWKFGAKVGPAPDKEGTLIPDEIILEARKIAGKET